MMRAFRFCSEVQAKAASSLVIYTPVMERDWVGWAGALLLAAGLGYCAVALVVGLLRLAF